MGKYIKDIVKINIQISILKTKNKCTMAEMRMTLRDEQNSQTGQ